MGFRRKKSKIIIESPDATATRAVYQGASGEIPHLEFTFKIKDAGELHEVVIDMKYEDATRFIQNAITSHSIIAPPIRLPTYRPIQ